MLSVHSFWTRPQLADPEARPDDLLELGDYEALTWLLSALTARRHGRIVLVTDQRGQRFVQGAGLDWLYSEVLTVLDDIPATIDPLVFWAAGKVYAWLAVDAPAWSIDPDAILWEPPRTSAPVVALHTEDAGWPEYAYQEARYSRFGFSAGTWDWTVPPVNAGVVHFRDPGLARGYAEESLGFMDRFSTWLHSQPDAGGPRGDAWADAMLFAEQRLLGMVLRRHGVTGQTLARYDARRRHLEPNPQVLHLCGTKHFYRRCRTARAAYSNHLISLIHTRYPEGVPTLERWRLDQPIAVEALPPDPPPKPPSVLPSPGHARLGAIEGEVWIEDANLPVRRRGNPGEPVGPAEMIHPEPGTIYELIEVRQGAIRPTS